MTSTMQEVTDRKPAARRTRKRATPKLRVPTHDEIALRARALYEQSGYQGGRDVGVLARSRTAAQRRAQGVAGAAVSRLPRARRNSRERAARAVAAGGADRATSRPQ